MGKPWVGRREFVPPPSCSIISEASKVVYVPHTILFDPLNTSKAVCNPHTISFGLPNANDWCATHTLLHLSSFIPPCHSGGILSSNNRMRWHEIHIPLHLSWIILPNDRGISIEDNGVV